MRQLIVRAWDGEKFTYLDYSKEDIYRCGSFKEIQLWTGLFDKNGKKIFEGDVIEKEHHENLLIVEYCLKGHNCGGFRLKDLKNGKWSDFWQESIWMPSDEPRNFDKVIGNIHEHPHLLDNPTL